MKTKTFGSRRFSSGAASIVSLLEQGRPVKGKIAWIKIADEETYFDDHRTRVKTPIYAKVKILGLVQGKEGMLIQAVLTDGVGTFSVDPNSLVSSFVEVESLIDVAKRKSLAIHQYHHIINAHFKREQIRRLEEAINALPAKARKDLIGDKYDFFTKATPSKLASNLAIGTIKELARLVCMLAQQLAPDQKPDDYKWRD